MQSTCHRPAAALNSGDTSRTDRKFCAISQPLWAACAHSAQRRCDVLIRCLFPRASLHLFVRLCLWIVRRTTNVLMQILDAEVDAHFAFGSSDKPLFINSFFRHSGLGTKLE